MRITRKELEELVESEVASALLDVSVEHLREGHVKFSLIDDDALIAELVDSSDSSKDRDTLSEKFRRVLTRHGIIELKETSRRQCSRTPRS